MSVEVSTGLGRRFFEEQDRLRGGPADSLCAPNYTVSIANSPPMDLAGHKQFSTMFYTAFPDLKHVIEDTVTEGDRIAVRFTLLGTQLGNFMNIAPTDKPVTISAIAILRVADGQVIELHGQFDQVGMLQQLGVIPTPGQS